MLILTDENIPGALIDALRESGHTVTSSSEAGLRGHPDEAYLDRASQTGEIVLTEDKDFGLLQEFENPERDTRVLLVRYDPFSLDSLKVDIVLALDLIESQASSGRLMAVLTEGKLRLRTFNRG